MRMTFDEFVQLKALQLKASITGKTYGVERLLESKGDDAWEQLGMKNICFRISPVAQARLEETLSALEVSKQVIFTEMLWEMLDRIDAQLEQVGIGKINYDDRLQELGYEWSAEDEKGERRLQRVKEADKE